MRIAVYTIALNESAEVAAWEQNTRNADDRVVLDTGSTDGTPELLKAAGVTVVSATIRPWRFDDACNIALALIPASVDVCVRLDFDERLRDGWRAAIERGWKPDLGMLRYPFVQHHTGQTMHGSRVHARWGFRWDGPTHELLTWRGELPVVQAMTHELTIDHHPRVEKFRPDNLPLLHEGVRENKSDARRSMLLARALLADAQLQAGIEEVRRYAELVSHQGDDLAYLWRQVALLDEQNAFQHLTQAQSAARNASNCLALAEHHFRNQNYVLCYGECQHAFSMLRSNPEPIPLWSADPRLKTHVLHDLASASAYSMWDFEAAYGHAVEALRRAPDNAFLINQVKGIRSRIAEGATLDPGMTLDTVAPASANESAES